MLAREQDEQFFATHRKRNFHVRAAVVGEFSREFLTLGPHEPSRRAILMWRIPKGKPGHGKFAKIPFLKFADESIEDSDEVLSKLWHELMEMGATEYAVQNP